MSETAFPQDPALTAIAIAHKNPDHSLIAESVAPRSGVASTLFGYIKYGDAHRLFTLPETAVGPTGKVNRLNLDGTEIQARTKDNALDVPLSFYDVNATRKEVNARGQATMAATSIILLRHEKNVADLWFDADSYQYKETVTGADQFDAADRTGANALTLMQDGLDAALMRPNVLIFGQRPWAKFRSLPEVVKAVHGNSGDSGLVKRQEVAELFEVQEVVVGSGWLNVAKPGEAPDVVRVWGNHVAAIFRDRSASTVGGITFGLTAEYGTRIAAMIKDNDIGMRGGELARVGESTLPIIVAPHAGYFWENAIGA